MGMMLVSKSAVRDSRIAGIRACSNNGESLSSSLYGKDLLLYAPRLSSISLPPSSQFPLILFFSRFARLLLPFSPISRLFCYTCIVTARRLSAIVVDNSNGRLFLNPLALDNRSVSRREIIIESHR